MICTSRFVQYAQIGWCFFGRGPVRAKRSQTPVNRDKLALLWKIAKETQQKIYILHKECSNNLAGKIGEIFHKVFEILQKYSIIFV